MLRKLLRLLRVEPQKHCHDDCPEANAALYAAVVDAIAQPDAVNDFGVVLHVLKGRYRRDIEMRVALTWKHPAIALHKHQPASGRGQGVLRWVAVHV